MPRGRPKIKTASMTLRVEPMVKAAIEKAAKLDRRSVTSMVEVLIIEHCKVVGIKIKSPTDKE